MKRILFVFLLVTALFVLSACGGGDAPASQSDAAAETVPAEYAGKTNPLGAEAPAEGEKIFQTNCATCHGPKGYGDGPIGEALDPRPKNLAEFAPTVEDDFLYWNIAEGSPGTSMPPWKNILAEDQIWQLVAFIRTLK